jgi:hypothetical protein
MANEFIARRGIISLDGAQITGSLSATGNISSNTLTVTNGITGTATSASYVEYSNVAGKPALVSGSSQISFNGITDKPTLVSGSSQITYSGLSSIPSGIVSSSAQVGEYNIFATTGSNTFQANQIVTGSLFITQNLVVAGSSSIQYISSSVVDIADNIITVNAFNPGVRFGGLAVADSGSSPRVSGSILFDSIKDQWIFVHESSATTSSVLLMGPETYNDLGNETYLSANRLPKGSGIEHLRDSNITDTGTVVSVNSNTAVTGSFTVVSGSAVELQVTNTGVNIGSALIDSHNVTGSLRVTGSMIVTGSGTFSSSITAAQFITGGTPSNTAGFTNSFYAESNIPSLTLSNTGTNAGKFTLGATNGSFGVWNNATSTYPLFINSSNNIGIGTTSPGRSLEIYKAGSATAQLKIGDASTSKGYLGVFSNAVYINAGGTYDGSWSTDGSNGIAGIVLETTNGGSAIAFGTAASNTSPSERMRITAGGNIGINTNSPTTYSLAGRHMELFGGGDYSFFHNNTTTVKSFYAINEASLLAALFTFSNHPLTLGTNNTERMRITAGGSLLVNRTSTVNDATYKFVVKNSTNVNIGFGIQGGESSIESFNDAFSAGLPLRIYGTPLQFYTEGNERMRITSGGALAVGTTDIPTLSTPNGGQLIVMPNAVIVSGIIALGSPYTQNIQIDIVYNNWGGNNVIGLVDMIITLREYANTGGTAFGKVFAVNSGTGATFSSFNTTNVTTSQCTVTASSGGNYTLRITIDPSNVTDRGSFYLTIPNAGGTGSTINSITVSYV